MGDTCVADGLFSGPHALQEIAGMTFTMVKVNLVGSERFADDVGRIGNERISVYGNATVRADKTGAAFAADGLTGIGLAVQHDAAGILVSRAVLLHEDLDRPGVVGISGTLDNVIVVLSPIE